MTRDYYVNSLNNLGEFKVKGKTVVGESYDTVNLVLFSEFINELLKLIFPYPKAPSFYELPWVCKRSEGEGTSYDTELNTAYFFDRIRFEYQLSPQLINYVVGYELTASLFEILNPLEENLLTEGKVPVGDKKVITRVGHPINYRFALCECSYSCCRPCISSVHYENPVSAPFGYDVFNYLCDVSSSAHLAELPCKLGEG